jgi:predicted DNA-binding protein
MAPDPKSETFMVRMSVDEREMLRTLAEQAGESDAAIVRRLVRAAFEASEARAPKKKR